MIEVKYTGEYPARCHGEWHICVGDVLIACEGEMDTEGEYPSWEFDDQWSVHWSSFRSGKPEDEWVASPPANLVEALRKAGFAPDDEALLRELFRKIQLLDWRHNSCGGCI